MHEREAEGRRKGGWKWDVLEHVICIGADTSCLYMLALVM